jgi:hypothetical protein
MATPVHLSWNGDAGALVVDLVDGLEVAPVVAIECGRRLFGQLLIFTPDGVVADARGRHGERILLQGK